MLCAYAISTAFAAWIFGLDILSAKCELLNLGIRTYTLLIVKASVSNSNSWG